MLLCCGGAPGKINKSINQFKIISVALCHAHAHLQWQLATCDLICRGTRHDGRCFVVSPRQLVGAIHLKQILVFWGVAA